MSQVIGEKGIKTRRRLLDATKHLLSITPLRDISIAQIVRDAQTSTATFYVYFADVPDAVLALIGEISQSPPNLIAMFQHPWTPETAFSRAHEFVATYVEQWLEHGSLFRVRNLASDEGDARFTELRINAVSPLIAAMTAQITARQAQGAFPADLHAAAVTGALLAMIERISVAHIDTARTGVTRARLIRAAAFLVAMTFGHDWATASPKRLAVSTPDADASAGDAPLSTDARRGGVQVQVNLQGQAIGAKGARTRQRIIEATNSLLQSVPLRDVSISDIAKTAGTSTSTVYLYFQDVPDVALAGLKQIRNSVPDFMSLVASDWDALTRERAECLVEQYIGWWQSHRALFRVGNLAADEGDKRFIVSRDEALRPLLTRITDRVAARQYAGRLPPDLHPPAVAGAIVSMIERLALTPNIETSSSGVTLKTISRAAAFFLCLLVQGL